MRRWIPPSPGRLARRLRRSSPSWPSNSLTVCGSKDAESEARLILERAEREAVSRRREAELEIKEQTLQHKAKTEEELGRIRDELRERERLLDKRQETIEQQTDDLRKQERIVEGTQRRLSERLEDTNRRNEELAKLLDLQRQTLHDLSRSQPRKRPNSGCCQCSRRSWLRRPVS